ncbi:MAG: alpha/beta hydrolase [Pseudomonadota bacterium]
MFKKILIFLGILVLVGVGYIYWKLFAGRPGEIPIPQGAASHYFTSEDGLKIHYLTMGEGVPILLIHGFFANADLNWFQNGIAQELAKTNRVIAIDNRGHGRSDKPYRHDAYEDFMWRDAIQLLDILKIEKAHIHGYSMGGSILTQILFHKPERVITAVYGGAGVPEFDEEMRKQIPEDGNPPEAVIAEEKLAKKEVKYGFAHDYIAMYYVGKNAPWGGPEHEKIDLTSVKVPVLAINGEFDSPNARTARMQRQLGSFQNVVLPGKAHLTAITGAFMPNTYIVELAKFIRNFDNNP